MEFRPQDVAQLVLGYLKDERCHSAFSEFINNCDHLKDHALSHSKGKYFITRVAGLSLVDYLNEYAVIYTIVQERLEASEYYTENRSRTTLVKQLLYLLENDGIQSRTSTPIRDRRFQSSPEKTTRKKSSQRELVQNVPETSRNNSFERLSMEVNTTLPSSLPGNSSTDLTCNNSSKRKSCDKSTCTEDDLEIKEKSQEKIELFTQTLLGNSDFIEKLTENINKEVSSKSSSVLDSSVIQHIVQQTEEDPVFVQLFEELMGTIDDEEDPNNSSPDKGIEGQEQELDVPLVPVPPSTPKKTSDSISTTNCLKQRLRSSKKLNASPSKLSHSIEEQNNDAVDSIIAAALTHEIQPVEAESNCSSNNTPNHQIEIAGSSGAYSNSIQTSITDTSVQNHMFTNTSGLLMLQPNATTVPCSTIATRNLQVEPPKPCYIIGNQPFVNVNVPQTPFKMLTEQDILTMPTIFVCDNNQQPASSQAMIVSQAAPTTTSLGQNRLFNIAPKATPEKAQTLSEYITLYQCNDSFTSVVQQPQVQPSPRKSKAKLKHTASSSTQTKKTSKKNQLHTSVSTKDENITQPVQNFSSCSSSLVQIASTVENTLTDKEAIPQKSDENKHVTPKAKVGDRKEMLSRSTPRSGSHVRKLVFGTPDKCGPTLRRSATSPKIEKHQAIKNSNNKTIRTTLFKSPDLEDPTNVADPSTGVTEKRNIGESDADPGKTSEVPDASSGQVGTSNTSTVATSWDADLRALAGPSVPTKAVSQKQKRKRVEESPKQNGNSKKLRESAPNHNKTEDDALKIEMALSGVLSEMETSNVGAENVSACAKDIAKPKNKRRDRPATKKAGSAKKAGKGSTDKQPSEKVAEIASVPAAEKLCAISVNVDEGVMDIAEHSKKCVNDQNYLEKPYAVINRNMKPRIRKKCNMENPVKKNPVSEEIVLTNVTRIKSCEFIDDGQNTLILSPSKLNANKRSLVEIDNRNVVEQHIVAKNINTDTKTEETTDGKLTTPEFVKTSTNNPLLAAKRNILPVLETPVKFDLLSFPKTPGVANTSIIDTPFTKAVIEQLTGVDINAIPTPKFPITPNFPFTPACDQSPFSNRGTDYSTSSSYYQPSDTEQNKSLEQLIEECRRLENQPASHKSIKNATEDNQTCTESSKAQEKLDEGLVSQNKNAQKSQNLESTKKMEANSARPVESSQHIKKILSDKEKAFNQSIIGKKNLHLVKMLSDDAEVEKDSSESSSTETDSSSTSSDDSDSSNCSFADDVDAVKSKGRNSSPYSLRPRKSLVATNLNASNEKDTSTEKVKPSESSASELPVEKSTKPPFKDGLLKEMEQIRQRTIAKFKDANSSAKKPDNSKKKKPTPKPKKALSKIVKPLPQKVQPLKPINKSIKGGAGSSILSKVDKSTLDKVPVSSIKQQRPKSDSPKKTAKNIKQEIASLKKENVIASNLNFKSNKTVEHLKTSKSELTLKKAGASEIPTFSRKISQSDTKLELLKQLQHPEEQIKSPNINRRNSDGSAMNYKTAKPLETLGISKSTKNKSPTKLLSPKKLKQSGRSPELQPQIAYVTIKDPQAMLDEEDFILHLSSDEENLEPFEMVETELLECSTSSTPIGDENRMKQIPDSPKEKSSEQKTQEMIDQEADSLVKGLKSWGIHLVPNKSVKKTTIPPESTETIFSGKKVDDQQQTEDSCSKTPKTTEKHTVSVEKPQKKLNQSIEEGELVSEDESSPKKDIKKDKKKPYDTRKPYLQKTTHSRRDSDPSRERRNQNQQKNSRETQRSRPYLESVAKSATASRNALPSKPCSSNEKSVPNKNSKMPEKTNKAKTQTTDDNEKSVPNRNAKIPEKVDKAKTQTTDDKSKDKPATAVVAEKEIITNELDYQVEFDVKTYDQETFSIIHDESKKNSRKITDYNFDILTKKFSANVYIAEIDSEVEKILLFSPFRFLLDIPSKLSTVPSQKSTSSQIQIKKKPNPLKILYNQLIKSSEDRQQSSPLDDLYAPESSTRENRKSKEESNKRSSERRLSIEKIDKSDKLEKSKSKPKSLIKENTTTKEPCPSKDEPKITDGISDQEKVKNEVTTTENLIETESSKSSSLDKKKNTTESTSGLEVVDGVIMLNSNAENTPYGQSDDELMNYAVIGSERVEDDESLVTDKKRKTTEEADEGKNQEKKQKTEVCQELLRNIDVDSFLKKLHGET